jgi:multisubunit Na+/H+ antiporter MnhC subunit
MFTNLVEVVKANKAVIIRRTLVVTGVIIGLALAGVVMAKNAEANADDEQDGTNEISTEEELDRR